MTLWRNGTPGLEKQLITWIVAGKWTMTEEREWIPIGCNTDCLFVLRCWLSGHVSCPLCQTNIFILPLDWYFRIYRLNKSIQVYTLPFKAASCGLSGRELSFWVIEQQNSKIGVNWGLDLIISLSVWVPVSEWVHAWLQSLLKTVIHPMWWMRDGVKGVLWGQELYLRVTDADSKLVPFCWSCSLSAQSFKTLQGRLGISALIKLELVKCIFEFLNSLKLHSGGKCYMNSPGK